MKITKRQLRQIIKEELYKVYYDKSRRRATGERSEGEASKEKEGTDEFRTKEAGFTSKPAYFGQNMQLLKWKTTPICPLLIFTLEKMSNYFETRI